jgi:hypothetical protein
MCERVLDAFYILKECRGDGSGYGEVDPANRFISGLIISLLSGLYPLHYRHFLKAVPVILSCG